MHAKLLLHFFTQSVRFSSREPVSASPRGQRAKRSHHSMMFSVRMTVRREVSAATAVTSTTRTAMPA
jgi:hypothetical protein